MNMRHTEALTVIEYAGTPRSGKGTVVDHQVETFDGVAGEETGADYRATTLAMLDQGVIDPEMDPVTITKAVTDVRHDELVDMVANRHQLVAERGKDALYTPVVDGTVPLVSPISAVRKAVKAGFQRRVMAVAARDDVNVLLVDGRSLAAVLEPLRGVNLVARYFLTCTVEEAARREAARHGLTDQAEIRRIHDNLARRKQLDENREIDPVVADANALSYWQDPGLIARTLMQRARALYQGAGHEWEAVLANKLTPDDLRVRIGAGTIAAATRAKHRRQVHFDTTDVPIGVMKNAADQMIYESLEQVGIRL